MEINNIILLKIRIAFLGNYIIIPSIIYSRHICLHSDQDRIIYAQLFSALKK